VEVCCGQWLRRVCGDWYVSKCTDAPGVAYFLLQSWRKFRPASGHTPLYHESVLYRSNYLYLAQGVGWIFYFIGMDLDSPWPRSGSRSRFNGTGLSLPSICPRIRGLHRLLLPDSVEARTIAPFNSRTLFSSPGPGSRALDNLDKVCPANPVRSRNAEFLEWRY